MIAITLSASEQTHFKYFRNNRTIFGSENKQRKMEARSLPGLWKMFTNDDEE